MARRRNNFHIDLRGDRQRWLMAVAIPCTLKDAETATTLRCIVPGSINNYRYGYELSSIRDTNSIVEKSISILVQNVGVPGDAGQNRA